MCADSRIRRLLSLVFSLLFMLSGIAFAPSPSVAIVYTVRINEIRHDQNGTDSDEYFELYGTPAMPLDDYTYICIGDGSVMGSGSGVIECVVPLTGQTMPGDGYFVVAEPTFTLGTPDYTTASNALNFENSDNVTHMLVKNFSGALNQDLDTNDDGVFDVTPWTELTDKVAVIMQENPPASTEYHYGPPTAGPSGSLPPAHVYYHDSEWYMGSMDIGTGLDTPGYANPAGDFALRINEIRADQPGTDDDEYFELYATPGLSLSTYTYICIGDSAAGGSGVIECVVPLTGQTVPDDGYCVVAEPTFKLGTADYTTEEDRLVFENGDNTTHLLVRGFYGSLDQDLDTDDDGVLDVGAWTEIVDKVAIIAEPNPPVSAAWHYGPPSVGPDGSLTPMHVYFDGSVWRIGPGDPNVGCDTPGAANPNTPQALEDAYAATEDTLLSVPAPGVLENDTDSDADPLEAFVLTQPANGEVTLHEEGSFNYLANTDYNGTDTFTYRAYDGVAYSLPATVTVTVAPVNDAPSFTKGPDVSVVEDSGAYSSSWATAISAGPANESAQSLTFNVTPQNTSLFSVQPAVAANGRLTFTPAAGQSGSTQVNVTLTDDATAGGAAKTTAAQTFTITVTSGPVLPVGVVRVAGADRYATGVEGSKKAFPSGADTVVIATGANWPDALGGSALAGACEGPLLLVKPTSLPTAVRDEIIRLKANKAYVLGGTAALSPAVEDALKTLLGSGNVTRLAGSTRYATARAVADEVIKVAGPEYDGTAFVSTGGNFPDALAASPLAAAKVWPILLANPSSGALYVPAATTKAYILGGEGAVSAAVETSLKTKLGQGNVTRIGGANRYATAALVAEHGESIGLNWNGVGIATGTNFPDALSGGAMLGAFDTVMLLTRGDVLASQAEAALKGHAADIDTLFIIGGTGAVSASVETAAKTAAGL